MGVGDAYVPLPSPVRRHASSAALPEPMQPGV